MKSVHDSGYKRLFSNKVIFRQLIETFVTEDWVSEIDFDSCQPIDKSFISKHYKKTESDLIYKVNFRGKEAYIFILLEFQSTVDNFMALRVLNYITNFYMDFVESNKNTKKLPPVFPILLYNGDDKWTAETKFENLITNHEILGNFSVKFEYFKIIENEYSKRELLKMRNIVSTLFLAESYYDIELLKKEFLAIFRNEKDKQAVSIFLNWFQQLAEHQKINESDFKEINQVYKNAEELKSMLITAIEKDRKELVLKGELLKSLNIAKTMLENGEPIEKIKLYTKLTEKEILALNN